jgi:DNA-binding LacI/PurR family transcriptional regulator
MLRQYSVDGVILASSTLPPDFPLAFRAAGLPVVHSFGRWSEDPAVHLVGVDNRACGRLAAETLLARGYRRLAFLGGPKTATSTEDRLAGFLAALADHPGVTVSASFAPAYAFDAGRQEMQRLLALGPPAEAYFCGDDILSIGAISALRDAGLDVPRDVGILGFNDMEMAGWPGFDLTTIRQPIAQIIDASIERIVASLNDGAAKPVAQVFECEIVERATLRPLP